jgi:aldose sugar dehydrogenase
MNCKYFNSDLRLTTKLGVIIMNATFALFANTVFSQTPELFVEKVLINNMAAPWGFTFINSNEVLFTEKQGKVYHYYISSGTLNEISGVPAVSQNGQGGLLDIALHPNFSSNNLVYLTYAVNATGGQTTALGRGELVGEQLQNFTELFRALPIRNSGTHFGSRIVFDRNNLLYMSVGDRGSQDEAQNKNNHLGKVLRFNDDGTVPASNPLVGVPNTKPEIFCWGNRNIQGMAMNPATGEIYAHEHGPRGGDELNLIKPNTNYGWPEVTFGINYNGTPITPDTTLPGMELPLTYWVPSIAPSGMTFISNGQPNDEADILIGALAGTHLHWLKMKGDKKVSSSRSMNGYARFRDVRQAPDGKIYAMTETPNRFVQLRSSVPIITSKENESVALTEKSILYPNPSFGESTLTFDMSNNQMVSVRILSTNGTLIKEITSQSFSKGKHSLVIESDELPQGFYYIEIDRGGSKTVLKLIKM